MAHGRSPNLGETLSTRVHLCGRLVVAIDGRRLEDGLPGNQGRLLFAYLAANRAQPSSRAELTRALWPEDTPASADAGLAALLSKLRRALGAETLAGRSEVRLVLPPDAWVDLEAAAEAIHRAEACVAREDWTAAWGPARAAQHIAVRGFMLGGDAPWAEEVRGRVDEMYLRALELAALASLGIGGGELATAERTARTLVARAPYRESGHRLLMEVLVARGNPAEALIVYDVLRRRLRDELGVAPSPTAQALLRRLLGTREHPLNGP